MMSAGWRPCRALTSAGRAHQAEPTSAPRSSPVHAGGVRSSDRIAGQCGNSTARLQRSTNETDCDRGAWRSALLSGSRRRSRRPARTTATTPAPRRQSGPARNSGRRQPTGPSHIAARRRGRNGGSHGGPASGVQAPDRRPDRRPGGTERSRPTMAQRPRRSRQQAATMTIAPDQDRRQRPRAASSQQQRRQRLPTGRTVGQSRRKAAVSTGRATTWRPSFGAPATVRGGATGPPDSRSQRPVRAGIHIRRSATTGAAALRTDPPGWLLSRAGTTARSCRSAGSPRTTDRRLLRLWPAGARRSAASGSATGPTPCWSTSGPARSSASVHGIFY